MSVKMSTEGGKRIKAFTEIFPLEMILKKRSLGRRERKEDEVFQIEAKNVQRNESPLLIFVCQNEA
jgi:hypothetical protein